MLNEKTSECTEGHWDIKRISDDRNPWGQNLINELRYCNNVNQRKIRE